MLVFRDELVELTLGQLELSLGDLEVALEKLTSRLGEVQLRGDQSSRLLDGELEQLAFGDLLGVGGSCRPISCGMSCTPMGRSSRRWGSAAIGSLLSVH